MNQIMPWLEANGIVTHDNHIFVMAGISLALTALALAVGYAVGRVLAGPLTALWSNVSHQAEGLGPRIPKILRYLVSLLLLAIILAVYPWKPIAATPLALALGVTGALATMQVLRGLYLPRWIAWLVAGVIFVTLFSHAVGGLTPITHILERVGFDVGKQRFSLLSLIEDLIIVVALLAAIRLANRVIGHSIANTPSLDPTQRLLVQKLAGLAVIAAAFFFGIDLLGINLTAFAVFGGAMGLAVGFGLQKTVGNLIAGIILLMDRSIKPGDVIVVGDSFGWVNKIGVRAVSVVTRDGKEHLIPNENLMTQEVENWSYSDRKVRIRIPVGVSYDCDIKLAQELMLQAASASPRVLKTPKPNIWMSGYGDSSVDHIILVWITDPEGGVGSVKSDVLNRLWWLFKENHIEIPFPQRDVNIRSLPAAESKPTD
jgi:small-conductance mechanosensitive channel